MWLYMCLPLGAMGWSAVCDCGISWPYSLIFFNEKVFLTTLAGADRISGKGVCMFRGMGAGFADFISFF